MSDHPEEPPAPSAVERQTIRNQLLLGQERRQLVAAVRASTAYVKTRGVARIFRGLATAVVWLGLLAVVVGAAIGLSGQNGNLVFMGMVFAVGALWNALLLAAAARVIETLADLGDMNAELLHDRLVARYREAKVD